MYKIVSKYKPNGDQPDAIKKLVSGIKSGKKRQVLLGATGTGKTFTIANVIKEVNKPTLVLAHNKTLAGQLYGELKELFPNDTSLDYHNLNLVHNGSEAMDIYAHLGERSKEEQIIIKDSLLKYCCLDTYAMVKIYDKLKETIK